MACHGSNRCCLVSPTRKIRGMCVKVKKKSATQTLNNNG